MPRLVRRSLRFRIAAGTALLGLGCALLLGLALYVMFARALDRQVSAALAERMAAAQATVQVERSGRVEVLDSTDDAVLDASVWLFQDGQAVAVGGGPAPVQQAAAALAGKDGPATVVLPAQSARLAAQPVMHHGKQVATLVIGVDTRAYQHSLRLAATFLAIAMAAFVMGVTVLAAVATDRALRPVARMAATADDWVEHNPGARFNLGDPTDEITALGATLDALLVRIDRSMALERHLTAEIAHELRTPLAGMLLTTEVALDSVDEEVRTDSMEAIRDQAVHLSAVIEALLAATRAGLGATTQTCTVRDALAAHRPPPDGPALQVSGDLQAVVAVPPDLAERILAPVLDNAYQHADGRVSVVVRSDAHEVLVTITDDGPGLPAGIDAEEIFLPGTTSRVGGSGLGLALARRLARTAGGEVGVSPDADRAEFRVRLPGPGRQPLGPAQSPRS